MAKVLMAITLLLIVVSLPHALEDLSYGDILKLNLDVSVAVIILITAYSVQFAGVWLLLHRRWIGAAILGLIGAVWCVGAATVHGHDLLFAGPQYRHGLLSRSLEIGIITLGGLAAVLGFAVVRTMIAQPPYGQKAVREQS